MTEIYTTKLNPENHLLLDQSLLRLPLELQRRNFKKSQIQIDHEQKTMTALLKEATKNAGSASSTDTLNALDNMINRMERLKRRLETLHSEEQRVHDQSAKRIRHLQELYEFPSLADVKYENWSRTRLDRLVVDYLLRSGCSDTASALAETKDIEDLIDLDTFTSCHKIADSIQNGDTVEALQWVKDNRDALKKLLEKPATTTNNTSPVTVPKISTLEFELRFQEYIELLRQCPCRESARYEALVHAQKYLSPHTSTHQVQACTMAGLLAQDPSDPGTPYSEYFSPTRWTYLSSLFVDTHHQLYNLPTRPLLHVALSAGLSALKTPACHSAFNPASSAQPNQHAKLMPVSNKHSSLSIGTSLCPICSVELNDLARSVPYAHHTKSSVESDPMMLPNGRVYGRERLEELEKKNLRMIPLSGRDKDTRRAGAEVQDPVTGETFGWNELKKIFIT